MISADIYKTKTQKQNFIWKWTDLCHLEGFKDIFAKNEAKVIELEACNAADEAADNFYFRQ